MIYGMAVTGKPLRENGGAFRIEPNPIKTLSRDRIKERLIPRYDSESGAFKHSAASVLSPKEYWFIYSPWNCRTASGSPRRYR